MLKELIRCNSLGDDSGLFFIAQMVRNQSCITVNEINNRCSFENGINVHCSGALAFFDYLGLIQFDSKHAIALSALNEINPFSTSSFKKVCISLSIKQMIDDGIFDSDVFSFNSSQGKYLIKSNAFPLSHAAIRNYLLNTGALQTIDAGFLSIPTSSEKEFEDQILKRRTKISLEALLKQQERQRQRGLESENFVLQLEQKRLPLKSNSIKRISDFDVSAGYDIASFESSDSVTYDRFIEVKSFTKDCRFFWSSNEIDTARIKQGSYYLCIVDYNKITQPGYFPLFIQNPTTEIFDSGKWIINVASYEITQIPQI